MNDERHFFGIYIHWPYCIRKCRYCSFNSFVVADPHSDELLSAIMKQYHEEKLRHVGGEAVSIYFGGGTPSLMKAHQIAEILERISHDFSLDGLEITLETNPGTVTAARLAEFKSAGINRLSLGVQSFNDEVLDFLGRPHSALEALEVFNAARRTGFENIGIDLIIGPLPQSDERLAEDLRIIGELSPEFVSAYMLSIEENTEFARMQANGERLSRSEEDICNQYENLCDYLENIGIRQYEISNFARSGYEAVHNSLYWTACEYMGLGPGAHGFYYNKRYTSAVRYACIGSPDKYMEAVRQGACNRQTEETLDSETLSRELIFCQLRTSAGLDLNLLKNRYGLDLLHDRLEVVSLYLEKSFIEIKDGENGAFLCLTPRGRLFADEVSLDFF